MKFTKYIPLALVTSLALGSTLAVADDDALAMLSLQGTNVSMDQAIDKVSSSYPGLVQELELDDYQGQSVYEIKLFDIKQNKEHKVKLSTQSGEVLEAETSNTYTMGMDQLDSDERIALEHLQKSRLSLKEMLNKVSNKYPGWVTEFELENKKGLTFYQFTLTGERGEKEVFMDVQTGNMALAKS